MTSKATCLYGSAEPLVFEIGRPGRRASTLPALDVPATDLPPAEMLRDDLPLPEVSELELVRHYIRLSQLNWAVDVGFYPLGSCTMKYNPKVNEVTSRLPGFANSHPLTDSHAVQGSLTLIYELQEFLKEIGGFAGVSLQPSAGAHGELTGILMIRKYLMERGESHRTVVLVPDSAHGTNPATTTMSGLRVVELDSDSRGNVDMDDLQAQIAQHGDKLAGLMLTNPNTLGLFDEHTMEICDLVHQAGGLVYGDGANLNAIMGIARPGDLGFDVMHFNLHKTFSTPHGGGGPGSGPVGCSEALAPYLPGPLAELCACDDDCECGGACGAHDHEHEGDEPSYCVHLVMPEQSIGRVKAFYGNFGVLVRAHTYIRMLGAAGLRAVSEHAVLNANYLQARLKGAYPIPHGDRICMHEFVAQGNVDGAPEVHTLDIAKRLMDYGHAHPPTIYFPLIVPEALMIEPTETETKETLDQFVQDLNQIAEEARSDPELLHDAPHRTPVRRLDEVQAARNPILRWEAGQ
jgi:glycine dehydrogenase subunit 2